MSMSTVFSETVHILKPAPNHLLFMSMSTAFSETVHILSFVRVKFYAISFLALVDITVMVPSLVCSPKDLMIVLINNPELVGYWSWSRFLLFSACFSFFFFLCLFFLSIFSLASPVPCFVVVFRFVCLLLVFCFVCLLLVFCFVCFALFFDALRHSRVHVVSIRRLKQFT